VNEVHDEHIFVSWQSQDRDWVETLISHLRDFGFNIWWTDDGVEAGEIWLPKASVKLDTAKFFIPVYSASFFDSKYCMREVTAALKEEARRKEFGYYLPILLRHCKIPSIIGVTNHVDFSDPRRYADALYELAHRIDPALTKSHFAIVLRPREYEWKVWPRHDIEINPTDDILWRTVDGSVVVYTTGRVGTNATGKFGFCQRHRRPVHEDHQYLGMCIQCVLEDDTLRAGWPLRNAMPLVDWGDEDLDIVD
jgi:hypothetical protein